jgi:group I intron endonuclease
MLSMDRRKQLKLAYKQNPPPAGVYQIKNAVNGKIFIGSCLDLPGKRNSQHFQLKLGSHHNKELQADWNLYGPDAFSFEVLETLKTAETPPADRRKAVTALEDEWLTALKPYDERGYNTEKERRDTE